MNLDKLFEGAINEVASVKRITKEEGQYKVIIKDGNGVEEFLFRNHRYTALRKELEKYYGNKVVESIIAQIRKGDSNQQFKDDRVDFEVDGDKVKFVPIKEEVVNEEVRVMRKCSKTGKLFLKKKFNNKEAAKKYIADNPDKPYSIQEETLEEADQFRITPLNGVFLLSRRDKMVLGKDKWTKLKRYSSAEEAKAEIKKYNGILVEASAEYDGRKWKGDLGNIPKVQAFIHKRYGLDKIALNDRNPDVTYDKTKNEFIISFEKTAKDPVTGKALKSIRIPFGMINNTKV